MNNESIDAVIAVTSVSSPTIQDEALLEAGKKLLLNSVDDSRNYCQQMIAVSTGAIPMYLAILKLWLVDAASVDAFFAVPAFAFLLAALSFSLGYVPLRYEMNIGNLESIEDVRSRLMRYRATWGLIGLLLFCLGIILGVIAIFFAA
jgi:hypothetical protein